MQPPEKKVEEAIGLQPEKEETQQMDQSFYRKQGLDFLSFQRPGTAYGSAAFQAASNVGMGTQTRSGFFDAKTNTVKPYEMI